MIKLFGLDHVSLQVRDLDRTADDWQTQYGLIERSREGKVLKLACNYEPYSLILREGDGVGIDYAAYMLDPEVSLDDAVRHLASCGVETLRTDDGVDFHDPDGNVVRFVPFVAPPAEDAYPREHRLSTAVRAGAPRKLGHVNYLTGDIRTMVSFYVDVVGEKLTDRLEPDAGAFLRIGPDHHATAFVNTGTAHLHHLAFDVVGVGNICAAFDTLAQHGRVMPWGPVRHGIGGNVAGYVRMPEVDCFFELYCDMEQIREPHTPRDYPDDRHSSNSWGMLPPRSYFRFDADSIAAERAGDRSIWV